MKASKSWWLLAIVSFGVILPFMVPYMAFDPSGSRIEVESVSVQYPVLIAHILSAFIALMTGFIQFLPAIRANKPQVHRLLGKVYAGSVFISSILALILVFYTDTFTKAVSFLMLSLVWLVTTWKGYRSAMHRQFAEHQKWMIRSFGITLVAVSGRILVPLLLLAYFVLNRFSIPGGREMMVQEVLNINIWTGLIVNLIIVEWIVLKRIKNA